MMKGVVLFVTLAALSIATAAPYIEAEYQYMFTKWMSQNEKHYEIEDFFHRYSTFKDNLNFINDHNALNNSYTLGLNEFADLNTKEFGLRNTLQKATTTGSVPHAPLSNVAAPTSVDWRSKNCVAAVKNQGNCGSCYAFSSVSTMETAYAIKHGSIIPLSEQQIVDCSIKNGNSGCNGGAPEYTYTYAEKGMATMASYPYTGAVGTCRAFTASAIKVTGYQKISSTDAAMVDAVAAGSILVEVEADKQVFQFYASGVLDNTGCGTTLDHGVVVVGYGNASGKDYWIVRNSWGGSWGESGYIRVVRGKNMCGITSAPYRPVIA